jgi:hypothetical protein
MSNASQLKMRRAEAVVQAMRTGEISAARTARSGMAPDVTFTSRGTVFAGDDVLERMAGLWPLMLALRSADWKYEQAGDAIIAHATFGSIGASPDTYDLHMDFNGAGQITKVVETFKAPAPAAPAAEMSTMVRKRINHALAEGRPITLAYVNDQGEPEISLRGSIQVFSGTQLCMWIRDAKSGLVRAINAGRPLSLLFREGPTRTTLIIKAKGRITTDEAERALAFDLSPEVEQRHDLPRNGAAAILDIISIKGAAPEGPVNVVPPAK